MSKLKFLSIPEYYRKDSIQYGVIVENPTRYSAVPNGKYEIRGNKKDNSKYYHVFENVWYLIETKVKDNGHYLCSAGTYQLFPQLSQKQWDILDLISYKQLSNYWRRARYGHSHYMDLRQVSRDFRKMLIKWK